MNYIDTKTRAPRHVHNIPWGPHCSPNSMQLCHSVLHREAKHFAVYSENRQAQGHKSSCEPATLGCYNALLSDRTPS